MADEKRQSRGAGDGAREKTVAEHPVSHQDIQELRDSLEDLRDDLADLKERGDRTF